MVVDSKVKLTMAVHVYDIMIVGSDDTCRCSDIALVTKLPTNDLVELT